MKSIWDLQRIEKATEHSVEGLKEALKLETAFRQELIACAILLPISLLLPAPVISKLLLILSLFIILITEVLNSAIEWLVNLVSPDYHLLAKRVKDMASAAVFLSLIQGAIVWGVIVYTTFTQ